MRRARRLKLIGIPRHPSLYPFSLSPHHYNSLVDLTRSPRDPIQRHRKRVKAAMILGWLVAELVHVRSVDPVCQRQNHAYVHRKINRKNHRKIHPVNPTLLPATSALGFLLRVLSAVFIFSWDVPRGWTPGARVGRLPDTAVAA